MTKKKELWLETLKVYMRQDSSNVGPTIPYLVGAYYAYDNTIDLSTSECIRHIMEEIVNSEAQEIVIVQYCSTLKKYVLTLSQGKGFSYKNIKERIYFHNCTHNIYFTFPLELSQLSEVLYSFYGEAIQQHLFSCDRETHEWREFSEKELEEINLALQQMQ